MNALSKLHFAVQRFLWVLVGCVFRQVDRYTQPQATSDSMAHYRLQLKKTFEALLQHVSKTVEEVFKVRNLIIWCQTQMSRIIVNFLPALGY